MTVYRCIVSIDSIIQIDVSRLIMCPRLNISSVSQLPSAALPAHERRHTGDLEGLVKDQTTRAGLKQREILAARVGSRT